MSLCGVTNCFPQGGGDGKSSLSQTKPQAVEEGEVRISNLTFEVAFPFSVTAPYAISRKCV